VATPDLHSSPIWIFDLDNTLHDASPHVFPHINRAMTDYVARHLGLGKDEASALRQRYWQLYGATLLGLMRHHGADPHHFLWHTHQLPEPRRMIVFDRGLRAMLKRLPGRKIVFSNGPRRYAELVLDILGVSRCFEAVFAIEQSRFRPKPGIHGFLRLLKAHRLDPRRCVMVEDSLENLQTARRLGLRTVWISRSPRTAPFVDLRLKSVLELPRKLGRLERL
jgi:putative hydrolase of the HAD superfamily